MFRVILLSLMTVLTRGESMQSESDVISTFTRTEIRDAIRIIAADPAEADRIADEIIRIPVDERPEYGWTDSALVLFMAVAGTRQKAISACQLDEATAVRFTEIGTKLRTQPPGMHGLVMEHFLMR